MSQGFSHSSYIKEEFSTLINHFSCASDSLNPYRCLKCGYLTHLKVQFDKHSHNPTKLVSLEIFENFTCQQCKAFQSYSLMLLLKHREECGPQNSPHKRKPVTIWYKCEQCPFESTRRTHTKIHSKCSHFSEKVCCRCQFCGHTTQRPFTMRRHILNNHMTAEDVTWFECTQCPYRAKFKHLLKQHVWRKHTDGPFEEFRCEQCSYVSNRKDNFLTHVKSNHVPPDKITWFKCDQCVFATKWSFDLSRHKRLKHFPSEIRWLQCEFCAYKTKYNDHLRLHVLCKHTDPSLIKWAQCQFCEFKTKNKSNLKKHVRARHKAHLIDAEEERWFLCDRCPYKTRHPRSLKEHVVSNHTTNENIKWFQCEQCSFKAKLKPYLRKHVKRLHANPEDVVWERCEVCDFKTKYKLHLREHVKSKHGDGVGVFVCDHCGRSTKSAGWLKNHVRLAHAKDSLILQGQ